MNKLDIYDKTILRLLSVCRRPIVTNMVATRLDIEWKTAKKHLIKLYNKKLISKKTIGKTTYWRLK